MELTRMSPNGDIIIPKEGWMGLMSVLSRISERFLALVEPGISIQDNGIDMPNDLRENLVNLGLLGGLTAELACMPLMMKIDEWEYKMFIGSLIKAFAAGLKEGGPDRASNEVVKERKRLASLIMEKGIEKAHDVTTHDILKPNSISPSMNSDIQSMADKLRRNMDRQLNPQPEEPPYELGVIALNKADEPTAKMIEAEFRKAMEQRKPTNKAELQEVMDDFKKRLEEGGMVDVTTEITIQGTEEVETAATEGDRTAESVKDRLNSPEYLALLAELEDED